MELDQFIDKLTKLTDTSDELSEELKEYLSKQDEYVLNDHMHALLLWKFPSPIREILNIQERVFEPKSVNHHRALVIIMHIASILNDEHYYTSTKKAKQRLEEGNWSSFGNFHAL